MVYNHIVHMLSLRFYDSDQTKKKQHIFEQKRPQTHP